MLGNINAAKQRRCNGTETSPMSIRGSAVTICITVAKSPPDADELFSTTDATMVEVNPLAEDASGNLIAADAKVSRVSIV